MQRKESGYARLGVRLLGVGIARSDCSNNQTKSDNFQLKQIISIFTAAKYKVQKTERLSIIL